MLEKAKKPMGLCPSETHWVMPDKNTRSCVRQKHTELCPTKTHGVVPD